MKNNKKYIYFLLFLIIVCLIYLNTNREGFTAPTENDTVNRAFIASYSNVSTMLHDINTIKPRNKFYILHSPADDALRTKMGQLGVSYYTLMNYYKNTNYSYDATPSNLNCNYYRLGNDSNWMAGTDVASSVLTRNRSNWISLTNPIRTQYINKLNSIGPHFNTLNNIIKNSNAYLIKSNKIATRYSTNIEYNITISLWDIVVDSSKFANYTFVCSNVNCI